MLVLVGAAVAVVAVVYWVGARPVPGDVIATYPAPEVGDPSATFVVRDERGGDRAFVELHVAEGGSDRVIWQALVPHYAGDAKRSGLAWNHDAITVRIERGGRAEIFALMTKDGKKLPGFRLAVEHQPIRTQPTGPVTLTDHIRSYELVGGTDWHELVAVDLTSGEGIWKADLGAAAVMDGGVATGVVWVTQNGQRKAFDAVTGRDQAVTSAAN